MKVTSFVVKLGEEDLVENITDKIQRIISEWQVEDGHVHIMDEHTTCSIVLNEDESCLIRDLFRRLDIIAPRSATNSNLAALRRECKPLDYYEHDDMSVRTENLDKDSPERTNGHSHVRTMFTDQPLVLLVLNGKLILGKWKQVLFFDFDDLDKRRERTIWVSLIGS